MRAPSGFTPLFLVLSGSLSACLAAPASQEIPTSSTTRAVDPGGGEEDSNALPAEPAPVESGKGFSSVPYPAPHPGMPQIPRHGGVVLHDPRIITVTFPADPLKEKLWAFGDQVGGLSWWGTVAASYGFGAAVSAGHVAIPTAPPKAMMGTDVETWLAARIADGTLPAPTDQSIYTIYYPDTTTITFSDEEGGGSSCQAFLGYHTTITVPNPAGGADVPIAYAVINRCGDLDQTTETASHEFAEAASDPHPLDTNNAGYIFLDDTAWTVLGGENADMCSGVTGVTEAGWALTRVWSNTTAAVGDQPCVPAPESNGVPYFNAGIVHESLTIAPGGTASTEVDCYSFGPLSGPLTLSAHSNGASGMTYAFDHTTCKNGDKVTLTVTAPTRARRGTEDHYTLLSSLDETHAHLWRGMVRVK